MLVLDDLIAKQVTKRVIFSDKSVRGTRKIIRWIAIHGQLFGSASLISGIICPTLRLHIDVVLIVCCSNHYFFF